MNRFFMYVKCRINEEMGWTMLPITEYTLEVLEKRMELSDVPARWRDEVEKMITEGISRVKKNSVSSMTWLEK